MRTTDGYRFSDVVELNQAGQAIGYTQRYGESTSLGRSAWFYSGGSTVNIGLTDAEHTLGENYRVSQVVDLSEAGQATGSSDRYAANGSALGRDAWLYDNGSTQIIGLIDAEHTRSTDGYRSSTALFVNEAGQVAGTALRFGIEGTDMGQTVWLYEGDTAFAFDALAERSDGYSFAELLHLSEDGTVIGYFEKYDETDAVIGHSLFGYSEEFGLYDYDFDVDISYGNPWRVAGVNGLNEIFVEQGYIYKISASAVPIPAAVWLFGSALAGLGWLRRIRAAARLRLRTSRIQD